VTVSCPRCHTAFVFARRHAQTTAAALGGAAGVIWVLQPPWQIPQMVPAIPWRALQE
jgi:hypothetical protein